VSDRAPGSSPFVGIPRLDAPERFAHIRRIEADQRVGAALGPLLDLDLNLLNRSLLCRL
jgi:hypothetical protein